MARRHAGLIGIVAVFASASIQLCPTLNACSRQNRLQKPIDHASQPQIESDFGPYEPKSVAMQE
jgi:hypothetical protein